MHKSTSHLVSGACSGLISALALQPLDLIKTRQQQPLSSASISSIFKGVVREDGVSGLWRGTAPTVIRNVPGVALYFYILQVVRGSMSKVAIFTAKDARTGSSTLPRLAPQGNLISGGLSRVAVGLLLNPITIAKARFESSLYARQSIMGSLRDLVRNHGARGLLAGVTASAIRDAPYAGIFVLVYEIAKDRAVINRQDPLKLAICGGSAAFIASTATQPFDVLKTRMQLDPASHTTLLKTSAMIFQDRGLRGYFEGLSPRLAKKGLSSAISWAVYETLLQYFIML